ncbi:MAG: aminodeoxychorismate/anthranilate synthase component II [Lachnospiraceae bacterium]|nr:aminodeoxychorismate/anthranilate synthase component II [Lachnospiraceae bacterium]
MNKYRLLLIDNYDSFSYNLYQYIGEILEEKKSGYELKVIRNDEMTVDGVKKYDPDSIVISPGPGRPADAGICEDVIKAFAGSVPILGVCLGHQAICESFGATITYADRLMHGKQSVVELDSKCPVFDGLVSKVEVARYHSLVAAPDTLPECLKVTAKTAQGEIMAVAHKEYAVYGLQFHPESILTPAGKKMLMNFLNIQK